MRTSKIEKLVRLVVFSPWRANRARAPKTGWSILLLAGNSWQAHFFLLQRNNRTPMTTVFFRRNSSALLEPREGDPRRRQSADASSRTVRKNDLPTMSRPLFAQFST